MRPTILAACACALLAAPLRAQTDAARPGQVLVAGTVADEAAKATLLARLREVYGAARVVDQLSVGSVATPASWNTYVQRLVGPNLKLISRGQLKVDGNAVSLSGEVANEAQRQQIASDIATTLNPSYTVNNGLRVAASDQTVLDAALAERVIEFESGKATLTAAGKAVLDQMCVALKKLNDKKVALIGHTDNAGARAHNVALSLARAEAVKAYVVEQGIKPETISVSGEGPDRPVADNASAEGRARNRRIEFKVVK